MPVHCGQQSPFHHWRSIGRAATHLAWFCLLALVSWRAQAGITAESTRIVFPADVTEQSVRLMNLNSYPVLVQAWVDDGKLDSVPEESRAPVVALPPIFRMGPRDQTSLRLIYSGAPLPPDRESLFWLNLYEIPPSAANAPPESATLTVTMRTQLKVFVRPGKLPFSSSEAVQRLKFSIRTSDDGTRLTIENPTPYFSTIGSLQVSTASGVQPCPVDMIAPFSQTAVSLSSLGPGDEKNITVEFSLIDDDGNPVLGTRSVAIPPASDRVSVGYRPIMTPA